MRRVESTAHAEPCILYQTNSPAKRLDVWQRTGMHNPTIRDEPPGLHQYQHLADTKASKSGAGGKGLGRRGRQHLLFQRFDLLLALLSLLLVVFAELVLHAVDLHVQALIVLLAVEAVLHRPEADAGLRRPQGQGVENRDSEDAGGREGKSCRRKNFGNRWGGELVIIAIPEMGRKGN